jgi:site-specific DNA-methyltransferase (adenine-specific)/modification methylase
MDCLEGLKTIPSKSIDLVITDPFYVPKAQFDWATFDRWYWDWNKQWVTEIKRVVKEDFHFILSFSSDDMARFDLLLQDVGFKVTSRIVWNYRNSCKATAQDTKFAKTYEFIFHCSSGKKLNFPKKWDDKRFDVKTFAIPQSNFKDGKFHQYQKPLALWREFIEFASNRGEIVLDPFMGSGTTALACKELERYFIGFELKEENVRVANERLEKIPEKLCDFQSVNQGLLFNSEKKESEKQ